MGDNIFAVIIAAIAFAAGAYMSTLESDTIRLIALLVMAVSIVGLIVWCLWKFGKPTMGPALLIAFGALFLLSGLTWHYIEHRPKVGNARLPERLNDGGDSFGSGGGGGGAAGIPGGGRGGNAYGTGGGGGGGSALGGGGGGGGEGAAGGIGGIGGGGKGAPGGSGGPGAIVIEEHSVDPPPVPTTLHQLYLLDVRSSGFVGQCELHSIRPDSVLKMELNLSWGSGCGSTSLWLYIPNTEYSFEASEQFRSVYPQALNKLDMQRKLPLQSGCTNAPISSPEERFYGRVYIYSEASLPSGKISSLIELYKKNNMALEFRGANYLAQKQRTWPVPAAQDSKPNKTTVIMMVGDAAVTP